MLVIIVSFFLHIYFTR